MNAEEITQIVGGLTADVLAVEGLPVLSAMALAFASAAIELERAIEAKKVTLASEVKAADVAADVAELAKFPHG